MKRAPERRLANAQATVRNRSHVTSSDTAAATALARCAEKVAGENDALALPPGEILLDEMIDPAIHGFADLGAEAAAAERRLPGEKLAVEPGGARSRDLCLNREV